MVKIKNLTPDTSNYLHSILFDANNRLKFTLFPNFYRAVINDRRFNFTKQLLKQYFKDNIDPALLPKRRKLTPAIDKYLKSVYFNAAKSGSFSGITQFYNAVKADGKYDLSQYLVAKWLRGNDVYTTTRKVTPKFLRPPLKVAGIDNIWEIDLADLSQFASDNDGYKYILMCLDVFSRYLWARPLKSKLGKEVSKALISILESTDRKPLAIRSDGGHDCHNHDITQLVLEPNDIKQYITHNELQANYVERCNKTIKSRLWRNFRYRMKPVWIDILDKIVKSYNNSLHSSIGRTPASVNHDNETAVALDQFLIRQKKYPRYMKTMADRIKNPKRFKLHVGNNVRIPETRTNARREYKEKWSGEVFIITERFHRQGLNVYKLKDMKDKPVEGTFAEAELQRVNYDPNGVFFIDEVVGKKLIDKVPYVEIKWYRWPKKFNSFIPEANLNKYKFKS